MENVRHAGRIIFSDAKINAAQAEAGKDLWLFSWMVTLWLEKHFTEIAAEFKNDRRAIQNYYRRFFHYLEVFPLSHNQGADGRNARQPCD